MEQITEEVMERFVGNISGWLSEETAANGYVTAFSSPVEQRCVATVVGGEHVRCHVGGDGWWNDIAWDTGIWVGCSRSCR